IVVIHVLAREGDTAVRAVAPSGPSVSWAAQASRAESAPPLKATTTRPSPRSRARSPSRSPIYDLDADALVALALGLGLHHPHRAHLLGRAHVGAAVGLLVQAHDVHHPDLGDAVGDEVDLGAYEVGVGQGRVPGEEGDLDGPGPVQLLVDQGL